MTPGSSSQANEDLCRKCGRCCREKVVIDGVIFYTDRVCRYWDPVTRLCTVYERRREVCPDCGDMDRMIRAGVLPGDCPYVRDRSDYDPPVEYWEDPEVEAIVRDLPPDHGTVYLPRPRLGRGAGT
jgi:uncharacterized cysteine cluster protein YcgN (CxxCxxCC family)